MIIQMLSNMSSGRHDGRPWPPAWTDFEVPDWEGRDLVDGGNAIFVRDSWEEPAEPEPVSPLEDLKEAAVDYAESEAPADPEPEPEPENDVGEKVTEGGGPPKPAASKQEWIDYAVNVKGAEWIAATNSTKQQLMEQYGQRP